MGFGQVGGQDPLVVWRSVGTELFEQVDGTIQQVGRQRQFIGLQVHLDQREHQLCGCDVLDVPVRIGRFVQAHENLAALLDIQGRCRAVLEQMLQLSHVDQCSRVVLAELGDVGNQLDQCLERDDGGLESSDRLGLAVQFLEDSCQLAAGDSQLLGMAGVDVVGDDDAVAEEQLGLFQAADGLVEFLEVGQEFPLLAERGGQAKHEVDRRVGCVGQLAVPVDGNFQLLSRLVQFPLVGQDVGQGVGGAGGEFSAVGLAIE